MKSIKITSIALAIILVALTSFKSNHSSYAASSGIYKWFVYNGYGDPSLPSSYRMALFEPECNSDIFLCAIYAKCNFWNWLPAADSLLELGISSNFFTLPYVGGYGQVILKDM